MADDNKRYGTLYEHTFVVEALRRNLQPHIPVGDYLPHDLVVYNRAGNSYRVQVKGTKHLVARQGRQPRFRITSKKGGSSLKGERQWMPIDCTEVEVLAAYIAVVDAWYLIPCPDVGGKAIWFYPTSEGSKAKYEKYRDNWAVFDE